MTDWTYFAVTDEPRSTADSPFTLVRLPSGGLAHKAEVWRRDGEWGRTAILLDIEYGKGDFGAVEITRERAAEIARDWVAEARRPHVPEDLVAPE